MKAHNSQLSMPSRNTPVRTSTQSEASTAGTKSYRRPRLTLVGAVTRLVQSGPTGNRTETYQGVYWWDR